MQCQQPLTEIAGVSTCHTPHYRNPSTNLRFALGDSAGDAVAWEVPSQARTMPAAPYSRFAGAGVGSVPRPLPAFLALIGILVVALADASGLGLNLFGRGNLTLPRRLHSPQGNVSAVFSL
jgi:hypothetical protein